MYNWMLMLDEILDSCMQSLRRNSIHVQKKKSSKKIFFLIFNCNIPSKYFLFHYVL